MPAVGLETSSKAAVALRFAMLFDSSLNSPGFVDVNSRRKTEPMLQVTQDALAICRATVRQLDMLANTKCLRLIEREDGVAISFELPRIDDELVHDRGFAVLAVPENIVDTLSNLTLDVRDDGRFILS